jgi:hypothetical protein
MKIEKMFAHRRWNRCALWAMAVLALVAGHPASGNDFVFTATYPRR